MFHRRMEVVAPDMKRPGSADELVAGAVVAGAVEPSSAHQVGQAEDIEIDCPSLLLSV